VSREGAQAKGRRYLTEGRLTVTAVVGDHITAECRGSGEMHVLGHHPEAGWFCSCAVGPTTCSHLVALQLVAVRRSAPRESVPVFGPPADLARALDVVDGASR
jgi:uncharacterized Zn finger protein